MLRKRDNIDTFKAGMLSVGVHVVLLIALLISFNWKTTHLVNIAEVELWEISLVTFPANDAAQVTVVKQMDYDSEWKQLQQGGQLVALSEALDRAIGVLWF